ncbi:hypothetical protein AB0L40_25830 [Patulibacter sp. NPDC049589]|uniref:hypothetical protein n=1 Tax=Patulibacter sp. NPDC049589 TaxID=3154731 RepID=UPI00341F7268
MSALRIRALLERSRRGLLVVLLVLGLGGAVALHHAMPESMPMDGMHGEHAMATCLGVIAAGVAIVVVAGVARRRRRRVGVPRPAATPRLADVLRHHPPLVRARAGPPVVLYLRLGVLRR